MREIGYLAMRQESSAPSGRAWPKWRLYIATTIVSLALPMAVIEILLMGLTLAGFEDWYSYSLALDYDEYVESISDDRITSFREQAYDPELGWDHRPGVTGEEENSAGRLVRESTDERGARRNPFVGETGGEAPMVLTFGDSYTFGAEVNDDETWPYHLSKLMETPVINYAVSAYGPDQALMKMEKKIAEHDPDLVIFGIMSENINRLMSMYRPFYRKGTGIYLGFKPMLFCGSKR